MEGDIMDNLQILNVALSIMGIIQLFVLFILSDIRARVMRLEDKMINGWCRAMGDKDDK